METVKRLLVNAMLEPDSPVYFRSFVLSSCVLGMLGNVFWQIAFFHYFDGLPMLVDDRFVQNVLLLRAVL